MMADVQPLMMKSMTSQQLAASKPHGGQAGQPAALSDPKKGHHVEGKGIEKT